MITLFEKVETNKKESPAAFQKITCRFRFKVEFVLPVEMKLSAISIDVLVFRVLRCCKKCLVDCSIEQFEGFIIQCSTSLFDRNYDQRVYTIARIEFGALIMIKMKTKHGTTSISTQLAETLSKC